MRFSFMALAFVLAATSALGVRAQTLSAQVNKTLISCQPQTSSGDKTCDFEIVISSTGATTLSEFQIGDLTNVPMKAFTSNFGNFSAPPCSIATSSTQPVPFPIFNQLNAYALIASCSNTPPSVALPLKIISTVTFDVSNLSNYTDTGPRNCAVITADGLYAFDPLGQLQQQLIGDCAEVPLCKGAPQGLEFWGRYDFGVNEPDAVGGVVPSNITGASVATTTIPGHLKQVLSLNAASDYVEYVSVNPSPFGFRREGANGPTDTGDFSIDFWIKMPAHSGRVAILDTRRVFSDKNGVLVSSQNGNIHFQMREKNGLRSDWVTTPATGKINDGQWHFVAITVDRDDPAGGVIYVDSVPATIAGGGLKQTFDPTAFKDKALGANNPLTIGRNRLNGENKQAFEIDELEIFHRVLTAPEIADLHAWPKCK